MAARRALRPRARGAWGPPEMLAHVAEMLPYWLGEVERILDGPTGAGPVRAGRRPNAVRIGHHRARPDAARRASCSPGSTPASTLALGAGRARRRPSARRTRPTPTPRRDDGRATSATGSSSATSRTTLDQLEAAIGRRRRAGLSAARVHPLRDPARDRRGLPARRPARAARTLRFRWAPLAAPRPGGPGRALLGSARPHRWATPGRRSTSPRRSPSSSRSCATSTSRASASSLLGAGSNLVAILANGGYMPADPGSRLVGGIAPGYSNSIVVPNPVFGR